MSARPNWREVYKEAHRDRRTDGCSAAPDSVLCIDLTECCAEHDFYYRNMVDVTRAQADKWLRQCIAQAVKKKYGWRGVLLPWVYWAGVRVGGFRAFRKGYNGK